MNILPIVNVVNFVGVKNSSISPRARFSCFRSPFGTFISPKAWLSVRIPIVLRVFSKIFLITADFQQCIDCLVSVRIISAFVCIMNWSIVQLSTHA